MRFKKYLLLVDRPRGPLTSLTNELQRLDFEVMRTWGLQQSLDMLRSVRSISLALVDHEAAEGGAEFIAALKNRLPGLPVLWHGPAPKVDNPAAPQPDAIISEGRLEPAWIDELAQQVMQEDQHDASFVRSFRSATLDVLRIFDLEVEAREQFVRSSRKLLSECSVVLSFKHRQEAGYVSISAAPQRLRDAWHTMYPERPCSTDDLEDLLAEIGNHLLGRLAEIIGGPETALMTAAPIILRGDQAEMRMQGHTHPLVFEYGDELGGLWIELGMRARDRGVGPGPGEIEDGEFEPGPLSYI